MLELARLPAIMGCVEERLEAACVSKVGAREGWIEGAPEYVLNREFVWEAWGGCVFQHRDRGRTTRGQTALYTYHGKYYAVRLVLPRRGNASHSPRGIKVRTAYRTWICFLL